MEELSIVTFKWGSKFSARHVERLKRDVSANLKRPHRFICITDDPGPDDIRLWNDHLEFSDGCYVRLKLFGEPILPTERFLWLDLDAVIVDSLDPLIDKVWDAPTALASGLHFLPIINGSFVWHRFGTAKWVWEDFRVRVADRYAHLSGTYRGTDQSWLHLCLSQEAMIIGQRDGLYAYGKSPGWSDARKPDGARIVFFPGKLHSSANVGSGHWLREYLA